MVSALISRCLILVLGTLFPAYRSYKAIKNKDVREHVKWMMYWIVFALFTTLETFLDIFFSWFPFYYEIKILFILWVLSPATRGSSLLYKKVVHPLLISREKDIDELIEKTKQQGYTTFLQLFSSGFQYASNLFLNSAIKGQSFLGNQLKKSLSMSDVYDSSNSKTLNQENIYFRSKHETIDEEETEDSEFEQNGSNYRVKPINDPPVVNTKVRAIRKVSSLNQASNIKDYEIINDDVLINDEQVEPKKTVNRRRASSKQLGESGSALNYKSNEASHFGTITRAKVSKTKVSSSSAQKIYDNDS